MTDHLKLSPLISNTLHTLSASTSAAAKKGQAEDLKSAAILTAGGARSSNGASDESAEILKMLVAAVLQMDARMKGMEEALSKFLKRTDVASDLKKSAEG